MKAFATPISLALALVLLAQPVLAVELDVELTVDTIPVITQEQEIGSSTPETLISPIEQSITTPEEPTPEDTIEEEPQAATSTEDMFVPGEVLVKFKENRVDLAGASGRRAATAIAGAQGLRIEERLERANVAIIDTRGADPVAASKDLAQDSNVEYAEPNYLYTIDAIDTDDAHRALLWALENTGQTVNGTTGIADADIDAPEAWELSRGAGVIVAVIDTGIDYTHPDLAANMWDGEACVDENGDALGGCIHGYDFTAGTALDEDLDPMPTHDHGTHVAGTIAAAIDNGTGTIGVAPEAKLMALRTDFVLDNETVLSTADIVRAINFARENGAKVINASFSGGSYSQSMYDAIASFGEKGGIFVAAAGNLATDVDTDPYYPAAYDLANIISVAATNQGDGLASFSNYGATTIDVGAPGVNVYSTELSSAYGYKNGTSMATPHVVGIAALLFANNPNLTAQEVKEAILEHGDAAAALSVTTATGNRVNAYGALSSLGNATTSTLSITIAITNDDGGTATSSAFSLSLDGAELVLDESGSTTLSVAPGRYHSVIVADVEGYTAASDGCVAVTLAAGASSTCAFTFDDMGDVTPPTITLIGDNPLALTVGNAYVEYGATATDDADGEIASSSIAIDASAVNTAAAGTYAVLYSVSDAAGNAASTTRSVVVSNPPSDGGGGGGGGGGSSNDDDDQPRRSRSGGGGGRSSSDDEDETVREIPTKDQVYHLTSSPAAPQYLRTLFNGVSGSDVTQLQQFLASRGYFTVAPTGYFGPLTSAALMKYQQAKGLPATGTVDAATRAALNNEAAPNVLGASIDRAAILAQIAELQKLVLQLMALLASRNGT